MDQDFGNLEPPSQGKELSELNVRYIFGKLSTYLKLGYKLYTSYCHVIGLEGENTEYGHKVSELMPAYSTVDKLSKDHEWFKTHVEHASAYLNVKSRQNYQKLIEGGDYEASKDYLEKRDPEFSKTSKVTSDVTLQNAQVFENLLDEVRKPDPKNEPVTENN